MSAQDENAKRVELTPESLPSPATLTKYVRLWNRRVGFWRVVVEGKGMDLVPIVPFEC